MKNLIFIVLCFFSLNLLGQQSNSQIDKAAATITKLYDLNSNQAAQYNQIIKTKKAAYKKLKGSDKKINSEAVKKIELEYEKSFKAILNEKQIKIFEVQQQIAKGLREDAPQSSVNRPVK
ncbi:MAG: hypothetical protein HKO66_11305 [Saprospiraceae bacterium]|nr:hypothetical protein [Bacteroidia bacterium]NNE16521.1 hypothetical protein [Saprospiraceae bacterium]NNL92813.1 hypothetical protein [Saprospiraceae bacterium]